MGKPDEFAELQAKFEGEIDRLNGNLAAQEEVNKRNQQSIADQKVAMEKCQKEAADERKRFMDRLETMQAAYEKESASRQAKHDKAMEDLKEEAAKKSEEDKKNTLAEIQKLQKQLMEDAAKKSEEDQKKMHDEIQKLEMEHQASMEEFQHTHAKDVQDATDRSDGSGTIHAILGVIPVVGPVISGVGKLFGWF